MFDISLYNDEFFVWHLKYARQYSIDNMDYYIKKYQPKSVVDIGCGIGSYLESCYNQGIYDIKGYDIGGDYAKKYTPEFLHQYIEYLDCTQKIPNLKKYDCVISFETAEHIEPNGTDVFVENIVNAANGLILFTAAPPGQDGCGHINCEPKEYWIEKFTNHQFIIEEEITKDLKENWKDLNCPNYIYNNLIVFKKNNN